MSKPKQVQDALDVVRFEALEEMAALAGSYWISIQLAAERREPAVINVHCRQVAAVTKEAFRVVKTLGLGESK